MKYTNLIKLLSVLVCIMMVLAACNSTSADQSTDATTAQQTEQTTESTSESASETETETETETQTRAPVDPVLENYFVFPTDDEPVELKEATLLDGEVVSRTRNNELLVMRAATVGFDNVVKETFTVYNTVLGKTVLTVENSYSYGRYSAFNWYDIYNTDGKVYAESEMQVTVGGQYDDMLGAYESMYIIVRKASIEKIEAETAEEEYTSNSAYIIDVTSEYYDVAGNKFADTHSLDAPSEVFNSGMYSYCISVGDTVATMDARTHELISVANPMGNKIVGGFDVLNGKYGYVLDASIVGAFDTSVSFLEIYDIESGELVLRHKYENENYLSFVLENGNVLITYMELLSEDSSQKPNLQIMGMNYFIEHYVLDISTGKTEKSDLGYFLLECLSREAYIDNMYGDDGSLTENVVNYALALELKDTPFDIYGVCILALDNDLSVMYRMDKLVPEQRYDIGSGITTIANGNYLVDLENTVSDRAIVTKDGKLRAYLPTDAKIVGSLVVTDDGIYDYDMNELYLFEDGEYSFVMDFAGRIIARKVTEKLNALTNQSYEVVEHYVLEYKSGAIVETLILEDEEIIVDKSTNDYLMTQSKETGKYTLYNINLEHILTTERNMYVYELDGKYIVHTSREVQGYLADIFYTVE